MIWLSLPRRSRRRRNSARRNTTSWAATISAARSSNRWPIRLTASVPEKETQLLKFHGTYQQDDRDLRNERAAQKLEPAYSFMLRVRASGGIVTPSQWVALDQLAREFGDGTLRLTTRQSLELHGILKWKLQETIRRVNEARLTSLATCGDVNRNVMCNPNPYPSEVHGEVYQWSQRLAERLLPQTRAYRELWIDQKQAADAQDQEPLYGPSYLPRKFKIGHRRAAVERRRRVHPRLGAGGDCRGRPAGRLQRPGRRRHGNDARRAGHLSASLPPASDSAVPSRSCRWPKP